MKHFIFKHSVSLGLVLSSILFLGCSPAKVQTASNGSLAYEASSGVALPVSSTEGQVAVGGGMSTGVAKLIFNDASSGDGTVVVRINQSVKGAGARLKACIGPVAAINTSCLHDSDFVLLTDNWGANSYNEATDTYSFNKDVSADGYPFQEYFTKYILADGTTRIIKFNPKFIVAVFVLKWVYTNPRVCVGPTPTAAPVGQPCASEKEARTNECGTVTCLKVRQ